MLRLKTFQLLFCLIFCVVFTATQAKAKLFEIPKDSRNYGTLDPSLHSQADVLFDSLETFVNDELPGSSSTGSFLKHTANSSVLATSGLGSDYSSSYDYFIAGVQLSAAANLGNSSLAKISQEPEKTGGFAPAAGIMIGIPLKNFTDRSLFGIIELNRLKVFANYFSHSIDDSKFSISSRSFGAHLQYKLYTPAQFGSLVRWNGVDLSTGYQMNRMVGSYNISSINKTTTQNVAGLGDTVLNFSGGALINAKSKTHTIPLEASSALRFFYTLIAYGGLGMDLSFGKAEGSGHFTQASISATGQQATLTATPLLNLSESKKPSYLSARYFVGTGLELGVASLYAQFNHAPFQKTLGFLAGVKAFW